MKEEKDKKETMDDANQNTAQVDNDSAYELSMGDRTLSFGNIDDKTLSELSSMDALIGVNKNVNLEELTSKKLELLKERGYYKDAPDNSGKETTTPQEAPKTEVKDESKEESADKKNDEEEYHFLLGNQKSDAKEKIENIETLFKVAKENTGFDINNMDDFSKLFVDYSNIKKENETLKSPVYKSDVINEFVDVLPDELYGLIQTWSNNGNLDGDYRSEMKKIVGSKIDYSKDFSDFSTKDVINAYFPDKFSDKDWEDYQDKDSDNNEIISKSINLAKDIAKEKFENDKKVIKDNTKSYREKYNKMIAEQQELLEKSVDKASGYLNKFGNDFPEKQKQEIVNQAKDGQAFILNLYFNPDGSWKEDAFVNLMYAKHGKEAIETAKKIIAKRTETKVNQEILSRGNDSPTTPKGSQTSNSVGDAEAKEYVNSLLGLQPTKHY